MTAHPREGKTRNLCEKPESLMREATRIREGVKQSDGLLRLDSREPGPLP